MTEISSDYIFPSLRSLSVDEISITKIYILSVLNILAFSLSMCLRESKFISWSIERL